MTQPEDQQVTEARPGLLDGKKGLIVGVANHRSIAWGIARHAHAEGAELAFTFQGEALERRVRPLADSIGSSLVLPLDVTRPDELDAVFENITTSWGRLDFLVHSIAWAERDDLKGRTVDTSREGFLRSLEISAYSLIALTRRAEPLMKDGGSIIALTFYGSLKTTPSYNVMGIAKAALEASVRYLARELGPDNIRVNAVSAGAIRTLSAAGIKNFSEMLKVAGEHSALQRTVKQSEVADVTAFLCSDAASGITGQTLYVDCGYSIMAN